jgi:drug/metabolite transporter (DMT)-like permease
VLLLIQPVGSVALGMLILGEDPSALQLAGTTVVLAGIGLATVTVPRRRAPAPVVDAQVSSH